MATVTNAGVFTAVTTNLASYTTPAFTPAVGDLLVAFFMVASSEEVNATCTANTSNTGVTFSQVKPWPSNANLTNRDSVFCFVANSKTTTATSMSLTIGLPVDIGQGCIFGVARVAGMTNVGSAAIKQVATTSNGVSGVAPNATFAAAPDTANPVLFAHVRVTATLTTPPAGMIEDIDTSILTPTMGGGYAHASSGITATNIALGATVASAWSAMAVELLPAGGGTPPPAGFEGWGIPI